MILDVQDLLVIVAHYDDEALFCGGTLLKLADRDCKLRSAVVTDVRHTNPPTPSTKTSPAREMDRQRCRVGAFHAVCRTLGAKPLHLGQQNLKHDGTDDVQIRRRLFHSVAQALADVIRSTRPEAILTHGAAGEYGHAQHVLTHDAIRSERPADLPVWAFDLNGEVRITIDWPSKLRLLRYYRFGGTQAPEWDPTTHPMYRKWCTNVERFSAVS